MQKCTIATFYPGGRVAPAQGHREEWADSILVQFSVGFSGNNTCVPLCQQFETSINHLKIVHIVALNLIFFLSVILIDSSSACFNFSVETNYKCLLCWFVSVSASINYYNNYNRNNCIKNINHRHYIIKNIVNCFLLNL